MITPKAPNTRLRQILEESAWSANDLACALRVTAAEIGVQLGYDRTTVAHWLTGTTPRPPVPELLAETFTRRLRRPVGVSELGFCGPTVVGLARPGPPPWVSHPDPQEAVAVLQSLLESGLGAVRSPSRVPYRVPGIPAATVPTQRRLPSALASRARRVGQVQVHALADLVTAAARQYDCYAGPPTRSLLASYLDQQVLQWLRAPSSDRVHRDLLGHAASLMRIMARTHIDDRDHGRAAQCLHLSARLADEASSPLLRGLAERDLATQATRLGHHRTGAALAEAALRDTRIAPPGVRAYALSQHAVSLAHLANASSAHQALARAEALIADADADGFDRYPLPALRYQQAQTHIALGDRAKALSLLQASLRLRPPHEYRTSLITRLEIVTLELEAGHYQLARSLYKETLASHLSLTSCTIDATLASLHRRLHLAHY
ncbi:tetratricopeptide repeat protein (plasmid) [Streptomyces sp. NBC_01426]|uniref:tetratricopeptide repeat protein n=1 Tax=Streptomyces sp. NBC_01426 TaxID=2975866 RepID=UPI002E31827F|nr:tetratricopeptide repeat protein [Streptomyces sp. NBC_01426]